MKLTTKRLNALEESLGVTLTPEQRLILLYWYGHEPRHGWDEEEFILGVYEVMHHYPDHRPKREDLKWLKESLRREAGEYLRSLEVTAEERQELLTWVKAGNSVYDNPWDLYDDSGHRMDYIEAARVMPDLIAQYAPTHREPEPLSESNPDDF